MDLATVILLSGKHCMNDIIFIVEYSDKIQFPLNPLNNNARIFEIGLFLSNYKILL